MIILYSLLLILDLGKITTSIRSMMVTEQYAMVLPWLVRYQGFYAGPVYN